MTLHLPSNGLHSPLTVALVFPLPLAAAILPGIRAYKKTAPWPSVPLPALIVKISAQVIKLNCLRCRCKHDKLICYGESNPREAFSHQLLRFHSAE